MTPLDHDAALLLHKLDAIIAEKVIGLRRIPESLPYYSTHLQAAWELVEKLPHFTLTRTPRGTWSVMYRFCGDPSMHAVVNDCCAWAQAETVPLAICRAVLASLRVAIPGAD